MGDLKKFEFLDLRANQLTALPNSLGSLPNLEKLDLRWNPSLVVSGFSG